MTSNSPAPDAHVRRLRPAPARIRTQVIVPLEFADGWSTTAEVTTFHGLVDGREHLALRLGDPGDVALVRNLGVQVRSVHPTGVHLSPANTRYLDAKVRHTGHTIDLPMAV